MPSCFVFAHSKIEIMTSAGQQSSNDQWSASDYKEHAHFVHTLTSDILTLLSPSPLDRILDIGCGSGELTLRLQNEFKCQEVIGVDRSSSMVSAAKELGVHNVSVMEGEKVGDKLEWAHKFDKVFSNATFHWIKDHNALLQSVKKVLKPGGKLVAECGGMTNIAAIHSALARAVKNRGVDPKEVDPWLFPSPNGFKQLLEWNGFKVDHISLTPRLTELSTDLSGWLKTFSGPWLTKFDEIQKDIILREVMGDLEVALKDEEGKWWAVYVRLRVVATSET